MDFMVFLANFRCCIIFVITLALLLPSLYVKAAHAQGLPRPAEPERLQRKFKAPILPKSTFERAKPAIPETTPPAELEKFRFILRKVVIEGVTVFKNSELELLYKDFLNQEISLAKIYKIADAITAKYRNSGYILSRAFIPQQAITGGTIQITVVEGHIDRVEIEGALRSSKKRLAVYAKKITRSRPLRAQVLEHYLLLINDLPGVKARSFLTPSKTEHGVSHLTLVIDEKLLDAFTSLNNRGSRFNGPVNALVGGNLNSPFGLHTRTGLEFITASTPSELLFIKAYHERQIGTEGTKVAFSGTVSLTEPGHTLKRFNVDGKSTVISVRLSHPFIRTRGENFSAYLNFSRLDSRTTVLGDLNSRDRLRVLNLGASYDFVDRFRGVNLIGLEISKGLNIFNATEADAPNLTRQGGKSDFTKFSGDLLRLQQIVPSWSLVAGAAWQYSFNNTLASQQFIVGGSHFARAYDASEITGDHGFAAKLELQYTHQLEWKFLKNIQPFTFLDYGAVWQRNTPVNGNKKESLTSFGLGFRYNLADQISGFIEADKPLSRRVDAENSKDFRIFAGLTARF